MHPDFLSGAIKAGSEVGDVQKSLQVLHLLIQHTILRGDKRRGPWLQVLAVTISTGTPFPLITSDFTHLLLADDKFARAKAVFDAFRRELIEQAETVDRRNKKREGQGRWTCNHFNPANTEPSISV